jgi:hypothetical protein
MIKLKFFIFDWGTPFSVALSFGALAAVALWPDAFSQVALPGVGLLLGLVYFLQKQKLEEVRLFKELFASFNDKYKGMDEKLGRVLANDRGSLSEDEKATLVDYLNLCSEEYLFYRRGYIHPSAWDTWWKGMVHNLRGNSAVAREVTCELRVNSYYGFERLLLDELAKEPMPFKASEIASPVVVAAQPVVEAR